LEYLICTFFEDCQIHLWYRKSCISGSWPITVATSRVEDGRGSI